ncbi:MAG: ABC transporter ATP-binding protein [Chloroflexota bacterium]|nr:ABC transporter ATP-binding protein [Chloroflexota bacterium]
MIEVQNLTKIYGDYTAVDHISFSAKPGEVVGLLGPNGAGKTTTMRMLTGFMPPTDGRAQIAGHDISSDSMEARRAVGYLPERVPIYPDMTVSEYVTFWAQMRGLKHPRAQVDAALNRVQLYDRRRALIRNLSKGMRQRLGLAQALVHNPPVLILDEPTIGIDPQQVIEVRETVRALGADHTVLFSTHILSEVEQVCDRVLIINKGRIIASGKPSELRRQIEPDEHLYVAIAGANRATATGILRALSALASVESFGDGFTVRVKPNADGRGAIFDAVVKAGWRLSELRPVAATLEDIFLDIVGRDAKAGEGRGA